MLELKVWNKVGLWKFWSDGTTHPLRRKLGPQSKSWTLFQPGGTPWDEIETGAKVWLRQFSPEGTPPPEMKLGPEAKVGQRKFWPGGTPPEFETLALKQNLYIVLWYSSFRPTTPAARHLNPSLWWSCSVEFFCRKGIFHLSQMRSKSKRRPKPSGTHSSWGIWCEQMKTCSRTSQLDQTNPQSDIVKPSLSLHECRTEFQNGFLLCLSGCCGAGRCLPWDRLQLEHTTFPESKQRRPVSTPPADRLSSFAAKSENFVFRWCSVRLSQNDLLSPTLLSIAERWTLWIEQVELFRVHQRDWWTVGWWTVGRAAGIRRNSRVFLRTERSRRIFSGRCWKKAVQVVFGKWTDELQPGSHSVHDKSTGAKTDLGQETKVPLVRSSGASCARLQGTGRNQQALWRRKLGSTENGNAPEATWRRCGLFFCLASVTAIFMEQISLYACSRQHALVMQSESCDMSLVHLFASLHFLRIDNSLVHLVT